MSLDFDSGALRTQHEDEDYDQEDYAREQELQQLLTDLPHDMLEDSGDQLSSYSDCSIQETEEQSHEPGKHDGRWNDHPLISDPANGYEQGQNLYPEQFLCDQQNDRLEKHGKNWNGLHNDEEKKHLYDVKDYCGQNGPDDPDDVFLGRDGFNSPNCYQENNVYHLPENFRPYTNGHKPEFNNQQNKIINFPDDPKEHLKQFVASDVVNGQSPESYKVTYKPYQNGIHQNIPGIQEGNRRNEAFEDLQQEFLGNDESSSENMQILQLQVLNKARERQLEELNEKLEKSAQQIRYLNHQLSVVKDEKDGLALSLHESQKLYQNAKEQEVHLEGQIKALETQIQTLQTNEEQILKQSKVAEVAMESMQKQLLELQRSDALQRAREQHEAIISALKQKYEQQVLSLEQKLDATKSALREQKELCENLQEHVKQLEKLLEETKCEKTEIINRLTRSLEESQKQCANLLQTGSMQETNQLRFQLQQAQSAQMISSNMNKALQEELMELKEEIALYESAAKFGVFLKDASGERHMSLGDSYVDLGIKKITRKKPRFCSAIQNRDMGKDLSKDEIIVELKAELERLLSSNKMKRNQITELQNSLKDCQKTLEEYKQLKAGKTSKDSEPVTNLNDASDNLKEEVLRLKKANEALQQEVEAHASTIEELKENEEKLKSLNQDLCCQMRKMVQDFDHDKQEAIDRCERTYQQHHEDTKAQFEKDLMERFAVEKQRLVQTYEETISQLRANIEELNKEITAVKECYIGICQEKDTLETTLKQKFQQEQQMKEEKLKKQLLEEKEVSLKLLRTELEEEHIRSMIAAKKQWLEEKEQQVQEEIALAKVHWEKEEKENKEQVFAKLEREWQSRLEEMRRTVVECNDCSCQTDRVTVVDEVSTKDLEGTVEDQRLQVQKALKENTASEEALKEFELELENKYRKNLASQVDAALTQAHAKWLQEYELNLKIEQEKWEKEHQKTTAKQLALVLSAAEEKWKKEYDSTERSGPRMKELEEKIVSMKKELELKKEEIPAAVKAELAKARVQWNKEKQEEILQIQEQNERDYRSFLDDHRNRIKEVLATAKEDLAKQKNDLSIQKEAEIKMLLDQKQREWEAQEAKRLQDEINRYEEKTLVELEYLLNEIHEDLVKCAHSKHSWKDKCFDSHVELNSQGKDKLKACLQKAYRTTVCTILGKKEREWKENANYSKQTSAMLKAFPNDTPDIQKYEELVSNANKESYPYPQHDAGDTGDVARPPGCNVGAEVQRRLRRETPLQETGTDKAITVASQKCTKRNLGSQEDLCCKHCCQELEKREAVCQDLKRELEMAHKHLQLAVKEHEAKSEQIQENEKVLGALIAENSEMKTKLKDQGSPPRSLSREGNSKPCASSDSVKGLEEMRAHYIKAVSKIKCDMLRYIRESKERAAEMIKVEVLRERQETARKMRKYYLTCLQQLLTDNGKHEGAEKKIMNAASKLATMAKGLETPLRHIPQHRSSRSALRLNSDPGAECSKRDCVLQTRSHRMESKSCESSTEKATDEVVQKRAPRDLRQQFDASQTKTQHVLHETVTSDIQSRNNSQNLDGASRGALPERYPNEDGRREKYGPVVNVDKGPLYAANNDDASSSAGQVTLPNMQVPSATNGPTRSGPPHHMVKSKNGKTVLKEDKCMQSCGQWQTKSKGTQEFHFKDTSERDEGSGSEWSSGNGSLHLDCGEMPLLYPQQKANTNVQAQPVYCEEFLHMRMFSPADENVTSWKDISSGNGKILSPKSSTKLYSRDQQITNPEHPSSSNSAVPQLNASPDSNVGKCCSKCLEKNGVGSPVSSAR